MFELKNKIVLVLGGRGFLGRSFCQSLSEQGATVISADLPKESKAASASVFKEELNVDQDVADVLAREGFSTIDEVAYCSMDEFNSIDDFDEELVQEVNLH